MRVWLVGILIALAAGCAVRGGAPEPLGPPTISRDEVPPIPMPPYQGAVRLGDCAIRLGPASAEERARRLAAIRSRLPADATVRLTPRGDRAATIGVAIPIARKLKEGAVRKLATAFAREHAAAFGAAADARIVAIERESASSWVVELRAYPGTPPEWATEDLGIVMRIAPRRGRLDAGIVGEPQPAAPVCVAPPPVLDQARVRAAVVGQTIERRSIGPDDVVDAYPELRVDGDVIRRVALVPFGRDLRTIAGTAHDRVEVRAHVEGLAVVDPSTGELLGVTSVPYDGPIDPWYNVADDAARVLGPR